MRARAADAGSPASSARVAGQIRAEHAGLLTLGESKDHAGRDLVDHVVEAVRRGLRFSRTQLGVAAIGCIGIRFDREAHRCGDLPADHLGKVDVIGDAGQVKASFECGDATCLADAAGLAAGDAEGEASGVACANIDFGKLMDAMAAAVRPPVRSIERRDMAGDGMTISEVRGHGRQKGHKEVYRGMEYEIDLLPKVKLELVIPDSRVDEISRALVSAARTGKIGDGKVFIFDVADAIRIRNDDTGEAAL